MYNNRIIANCLQSAPVKKLKIGQQLANIWTKVKCHVFIGPPCIYWVGQNVPLYFCSYLQINQFLNFFHWCIVWTIRIKRLLNISPHVNVVTTLPCEIQITIIDSKRFDKQNTLPTKNAVNDVYDVTLCLICFLGYMAYWMICLFLAFVV